MSGRWPVPRVWGLYGRCPRYLVRRGGGTGDGIGKHNAPGPDFLPDPYRHDMSSANQASDRVILFIPLQIFCFRSLQINSRKLLT